jgi:type IV pilus assembly protein PilM
MPALSFAELTRPSVQWLKRLATVKPKAPKVTIGLDIGSSAIKVVALGSRRGGRGRTILGQQMVPLAENSEAQVSLAIREAVSTLHCDTKAVTISVGGQWVIMRVVEMPPLKPDELAQALPIEAQRHLPFNIQDVVLDGAVLGPSEGNKIWVLIVACKRELLERRISWVQQAGLHPTRIDVDALALSNAYTEQFNGKKSSSIHALIDVGAQRTSLVVLRGDVPYLVRDIPWGTVKLIRHMAEQVGLEEGPLAQQLTQDAPLPAEIQDALKKICESLTVDLQLSFDFFENRFGPPPEQLFLSGGLSESPGFVEAVKGHFAQPVSTWSPMPNLPGRFAVAYGLALHGAA